MTEIKTISLVGLKHNLHLSFQKDVIIMIYLFPLVILLEIISFYIYV